MSVTGKLIPTSSKGSFIRCFGDLKHKTIVSDCYSSNQVGQSLPIIEGKIISYSNDDIFTLHGGATQELVDFQVLSIAKKSVCITILLDGMVDFSYDDLCFSYDTSVKQRAVMVNLKNPVSFRRTLHKNNRVLKLNVIVLSNWIESRLQGNDNISAFMREHLANFELTLTSQILELALKIIKLGTPSDFIEQIQIEALTQALILEIFKQLSDSTYFCENQNKSRFIAPKVSYDPSLDRLITYIEANLELDLSMRDLADFSAMSISNLQHKFKQALGTSLRSYIRRRRLFIAKQQLENGALSISEVAYNAGYRHPSNFTIAFKKVFGFPPQDLNINN